MAATNGAAIPATNEYDLMPKLVRHLDRHLIFPLLDFTAGQLEDEDGNSADEEKSRQVTKAKYALLKKTNMTDFVSNLYCELEGVENPPAEFAERRQKVLARMEQFEQETAKLTDLLGDSEVVGNLRSDKVANLEFLKKEHGVSSKRSALFSHWRSTDALAP
jgi:translation initiation factor 3 subunit E